MRRRRRGERRRGERRGEGGTTTTNKQTNNSNALYISETHKTSYSGWTQRELSAFVWRHTRARITNTMICPPWFMPSSASCLLPNNNQQVERKKKKKKKKKKRRRKKKKRKSPLPLFLSSSVCANVALSFLGQLHLLLVHHSVQTVETQRKANQAMSSPSAEAKVQQLQVREGVRGWVEEWVIEWVCLFVSLSLPPSLLSFLTVLNSTNNTNNRR